MIRYDCQSRLTNDCHTQLTRKFCLESFSTTRQDCLFRSPYAKRGKTKLGFYEDSIVNRFRSLRSDADDRGNILTGNHEFLRMNDIKDSSKYISATYFSLRIGLAAMAFAFPILLLIGGYSAKIPVQGSMSAYYHASAHALDNGSAGQGVMRDVFVGILFAVGVILVVYRGVTRPESYALNLAGLLALGIALFPMHWSGSKDLAGELHNSFALLFFLCIAYVAIFRADDTLSLVSERRQKYYHRLYLSLGWAMVGLPIVSFILASSRPLKSYKIFLIEFVGIYAFGAYWVVKTKELFETDFDSKAAKGRIAIAPHGLKDAVRRIPVQEVK